MNDIFKNKTNEKKHSFVILSIYSISYNAHDNSITFFFIQTLVLKLLYLKLHRKSCILGHNFRIIVEYLSISL